MDRFGPVGEFAMSVGSAPRDGSRRQGNRERWARATGDHLGRRPAAEEEPWFL